jgi:hypothetical protein
MIRPPCPIASALAECGLVPVTPLALMAATPLPPNVGSSAPVAGAYRATTK